MDILKKDGQIIWMIDDDHIQHFCFQKTLQIHGPSRRIKSFFNGEQALNYFIQHLDDFFLLPDIIFLDLNMPLVNGWQFLQHYASIKAELKKSIKIYVLSSSISSDDINRATSIPEVSGFFSKPLKPDDINQILRSSQIDINYQLKI